MYKLTILAENLSQMVIGNVSIQVSNKNLQKSFKSQIVAQKEISEKVNEVPTVVLFGSLSFFAPGELWYEAACEKVNFK